MTHVSQHEMYLLWDDRRGAPGSGTGPRQPAGVGRVPSWLPAFWALAVLAGLLSPSLVARAGNRPAIDMEDKTCVDYGCHADLREKAILHSPVAKGLCHPCHVQPQGDEHTFQTGGAGAEMCQSCHTLMMKNHVHQPVREGRCLECHDPHQSDFHFLVRADPSRELCLHCHANAAFMSKSHLHAPVAMGACILCHDPHSSWSRKLVISEGNRLCATCHEDHIRRDLESRHVHPPVTGRCDRCHDPHGSDVPGQLVDTERKVCVSCHDSIEQLIERSSFVHGAIGTKKECGNCHDGHSSSLPTLLRGSPLDTCLNCHNEEITLPNGRTLVNMAALLRDNPNHHGPIRQGDCTACHNPHAASRFDRLIEEYPREFYAHYDPKDYKLCFTCHRSEIVAPGDGRGVTRFRAGPLNLHYVHVSKPSRGRTCRACHAVHASRQFAHISDNVPYGSWQYKINFEVTQNGGRCGPACHPERSYDRTSGPPATESLPAPPPPEETTQPPQENE